MSVRIVIPSTARWDECPSCGGAMAIVGDGGRVCGRCPLEALDARSWRMLRRAVVAGRRS